MKKQKKSLTQIISENWTKLEIMVDLCRLLFFPSKDKQKNSDRVFCVVIDLTNYMTDKTLEDLSKVLYHALNF